jgi:hypothetical protein
MSRTSQMDWSAGAAEVRGEIALRGAVGPDYMSNQSSFRLCFRGIPGTTPSH